MDTEKEEIEIVVEPTDEIEVKEEIQEPKVLDEDLDALRQKLQAETDARRRAEQEAKVERQRLRESQTQGRQAIEGQIQAQLDSVENGIKALSSEADKLEQDAVTAAAEGRWGDHAKLTRALGAAQSRIEQLNAAKGQIAQAKEQIKTQTNEPDLSSYTPKTQEWIKLHPEFLSDQKFHAKAMAAHYKAQAQGIPMDSDQYFELIDQETSDQKPEPKPTPKTTAAPVTRTSAPNAPKTNGSVVKLSSMEAEIARMTYPDEKPEVAYKKYADDRRALINEGKIAGNA